MNHLTLIVDDDPVLLFLMKKLIRKTGFTQDAQYFKNGRDALEYLKGNYRPERAHHVIFLDLNMPEMNGWEFLDSLPEFASPDNTCVVIITSSTDQEDRHRAGTYGYVKDYVVKPVKAENLVELRKKLDL